MRSLSCLKLSSSSNGCENRILPPYNGLQNLSGLTFQLLNFLIHFLLCRAFPQFTKWAKFIAASDILCICLLQRVVWLDTSQISTKIVLTFQLTFHYIAILTCIYTFKYRLYIHIFTLTCVVNLHCNKCLYTLLYILGCIIYI